MLKLRTMLALMVAASSTACQGSLTSIGPTPEAIHPAPPLAEEAAQARLQLLHQRYEVAAADGLSEEECTTLTSGYQQLYARDPSLHAARFNVAVIWEACGELDQAEAIYEELAARQHPLNNLGALAWSRADHHRALELFERAVAADPRRALAARNNLAMALRERYARTKAVADFEAAELQLQNVLAVDGHNRLAYEGLARLYYDRGRLDDTSYLMLADLIVTQAQRVLELDGIQSADLYNLRGLLWMQKDDPARAIRAFQHAVALEPEHADANRNVAMIAIRFRDFATAARALETAMEVPEAAGDVEVWLALGVARRGLRDYDGAEAAYRRALELAPDDPRAWFNLGVLAQDHRVAVADDDDDWTTLANQAADHFRVFVAEADHPRWREHVAEAKDRIAVAEDTIATLEFMSRVVTAEPVGRTQAEIDALLELEAEASRVDAILGTDPQPLP
jgi:tetratricopeptide (TPR) repeat protein